MSDTTPPAEGADDEFGPGLTITRPTASSLRAMAHPVRLKIIGHLRLHGPATATGLAETLGLNSGATSYHLRQLAQHGFILEDEDRGTGRDRWWRAAHTTTSVSRETLREESGETFLRAIAQLYAEKVQRTLDDRIAMPAQWRDAINLSDWVLCLTPEETAQLGRDLHEVLTRYRRNDPDHPEAAPAGAVPVHAQFQVLPSPRESGDADDRA